MALKPRHKIITPREELREGDRVTSRSPWIDHAGIRSLIVLLVIALLHPTAFACLWLYGTDLEGHRVEFARLPPDAYLASLTSPRRDTAFWQWHRERFEQMPVEERDFRDRSDYAVALIHLGEIDQAIDVLAAVEDEQPGEYIVAANLGTAHEMAGDLASAARWIAEGMRRNPEAHSGSEWIHLRIIDAKQQVAADPGWIDDHSVLGLDFGDDEAPEEPDLAPLDFAGAPVDLTGLVYDIEQQLAERLPLVPPTDPVVGSVLADFGAALALERTLEHAVVILELAQQYEAPRDDLVARRLVHFRELIAQNPDSLQRHDPFPLLGLAAAVIIALLLIGLALILLRLIRRSHTTA